MSLDDWHKALKKQLITNLEFQYFPGTIEHKDYVSLRACSYTYIQFNEERILAILNEPLKFGDRMQILALKAYDFLCVSRERRYYSNQPEGDIVD